MNRPNNFRIAVRKYGPFEAAICEQWQSFDERAATGLELDLVPLDLHPLRETLFEHEGLKRGDWDCAFLNTDWMITAFRDRALVDLAPLIAADPPQDYPHGWTPSLLRQQEVEGQILGLPYHDGPECLIFRKDLFTDAAEKTAYRERFGELLRPPETWDEFRRVAQHFTRPAERLYGTVFAAFPDEHNTVYDFCVQLWTRGGELFDARGRTALDTPAAIEALDFYRLVLNDPSAIHPKSREFDSVKSGLAFAAGEVAMMVNWFGFAAMAQTLDESRVKGKVDIAPAPHSTDGQSTSLNVYWILSVAAGSPRPLTAYQFLRHCASPEMDRLTTLKGAIGCRKSTWSDPAIHRCIPFYERMDELHSVAREIPRLAEWPRIAKVIDDLVMSTINTSEPVAALVREAQTRIAAIDTASQSAVSGGA